MVNYGQHQGAGNPGPFSDPYGAQQQYTRPPQSQTVPRPPPVAPEKKKTKTIRNDVNLKKNTLVMVQSEEDPSLWYPQFKFDAGAPCSVSVFYMATEDLEDKLSLRASLQSPGKRVFYEKKLGCVFPPPEMDKAEYRNYGVTPDLYTEDQLKAEKSENGGRRQTWPVAVRLECVVPSEALEDHSLASLAPGCPMEPWIQSQTTYGCLVKHENSYTLKVHKQKIWVQGTAYELQEIYGLENANNHGRPADSDDIGTECVICMSEPRDTTLLPCRHMCLCHECAQMLRTQTNKCPICRTQVKSLLEITLKS